MIKLACPNCQRNYKVDNSHFASRVKCRVCETSIPISGPTASVEFAHRMKGDAEDDAESSDGWYELGDRKLSDQHDDEWESNEAPGDLADYSDNPFSDPDLDLDRSSYPSRRKLERRKQPRNQRESRRKRSSRKQERAT